MKFEVGALDFDFDFLGWWFLSLLLLLPLDLSSFGRCLSSLGGFDFFECLLLGCYEVSEFTMVNGALKFEFLFLASGVLSSLGVLLS